MSDTIVKVCNHERFTSWCGTCPVDGSHCIDIDTKAFRVVCHHTSYLSCCDNCHIDGKHCLIIPNDCRVVCIHENMQTACTRCEVDGSYCLVLKNGFIVGCKHFLNFAGYCGHCHVDGHNCKVKVSHIGTITDIEYRLDKYTLIHPKPLVVKHQCIDNPKSATIDATLRVSKYLTKSWTVTGTHGEPVMLNVETSVGVPEISVDGQIAISTTTSWLTSTSKVTTEILTIQRSMDVKVEPNSAVIANATIREVIADVPFTATIKYPDGKIEKKDLICSAIGYGELDIKTEKFTPELKIRPQVKTKHVHATPQVTREQVTPQVKTENVTPQVKTENVTPQVKTENVTPQVKTEIFTPQVKRRRRQHRRCIIM